MPLRIDDLLIAGPGQFAISCAAGKYTSALPKACKISWFNKFVPSKTHYEGRCDTDVAVNIHHDL